MRDPEPAASDASRLAVVSALRRRGSITRQELIEHTGLSRSTISITLRALLAEGRIREVARASSVGRGRPATLLELDPSRADLVGLEIGRAHVAVAIADAADSVTAQADATVAASDPILARTDAALALLTRVADEQGIDLSRVQAVAVGTPGPKFRSDAEDRPSTDLALARYTRDRVLVAERVAQRLGSPVETDNNTRYTALGESRSGPAAGAADVIYLRIDEGVGGGVVSDGALLSGHWGAAGEIGHISVDPAGGRCPCGGRGCLELVAALPALLQATRADTYEELATAVSAEPHAAVSRAAEAVGHALAAVVTSVNSSVVVLGGRVARLPGFCDHVASTLRDQIPGWCAADLTVHAVADDRTAGARGALVSARLVAEPRTVQPARADTTRTIG